MPIKLYERQQPKNARNKGILVNNPGELRRKLDTLIQKKKQSELEIPQNFSYLDAIAQHELKAPLAMPRAQSSSSILHDESLFLTLCKQPMSSLER
jgi:hypothetical protein